MLRAALAIAIETESMAFAPRLDLFLVPSVSALRYPDPAGPRQNVPTSFGDLLVHVCNCAENALPTVHRLLVVS